MHLISNALYTYLKNPDLEAVNTTNDQGHHHHYLFKDSDTHTAIIIIINNIVIIITESNGLFFYIVTALNILNCMWHTIKGLTNYKPRNHLTPKWSLDAGKVLFSC